jgi:hypothetical protein
MLPEDRHSNTDFSRLEKNAADQISRYNRFDFIYTKYRTVCWNNFWNLSSF